MKRLAIVFEFTNIYIIVKLVLLNHLKKKNRTVIKPAHHFVATTKIIILIR